MYGMISFRGIIVVTCYARFSSHDPSSRYSGTVVGKLGVLLLVPFRCSTYFPVLEEMANVLLYVRDRF